MSQPGAHGRTNLVRTVVRGLPGGPEAAQREGRLEVGPGQQWVEGGSIRTVCHLLGLVVLLGTDCLLWVTWPLVRGSHEESGWGERCEAGLGGGGREL